MKIFRPCLLAALCMLFLQANSQQKTISVFTELQRFSDISKLPAYADKMPVNQFSSYDRTGKNDDGFSGKYSFIRRNADSSLVIFEAKGKGVINRIWTPTPTDDMLEFYFDGHSKPDFTIRFSDLFSGKTYPFVLPLCGNQIGGYFCYIPIPYSKGCKVVFRGKKMEFYQIQYRSLPDGYQVKTFDPKFNAEEQQLLSALKKTWTKEAHTAADFTAQKTEQLPFDISIKPGETKTLLDIKKTGRIAGLRFGPVSAFEGLAKQFDLRITWDNEPQPAVYAPVADLFGYAFGSASMRSLLAGTENGENYLYFPMPFDRSAKIEMIYRTGADSSTEPFRIKGHADFIAQKRDPKTEGKFYAAWNKQTKAVTGKPHVFLEGKGRGHYVATVLQAQGLKAGMTEFFEGDDSTIVDGKMTMHGTGSEDYFNGGWYALLDRWDRKMSLPLHGSLDYSLPFSRTGGYRLFVADKLPFSKSFHQSIEHGPDGNRYPADYTSVAYYYAEKPLSTIVKPTNELTKVYLPDTLMIYPQLMRMSISGEITKRGDRFTAVTGNAELRVDLAEIPAGKYRLFADAETNPQGADVEIWQRQTRLTDRISFSAAEKKEVKMMPLATLNIGDFSNTVTFHFKKNGDKNSMIIHRLILVKDNSTQD